jgi:expansin (peptidoglycan-binding protein)
MDSTATPYACGDDTGTPTTGVNPQATWAQTLIGPCVKSGARQWCCSTEGYMSDAAAPTTSACVRISSHDTICSGVANADGMQRAAFLCPFAPFSKQPVVTAVNCSTVNHGAVDAGGAYVASNYAVVCCGM